MDIIGIGLSLKVKGLFSSRWKLSPSLKKKSGADLVATILTYHDEPQWGLQIKSSEAAAK